MNKITYFGANGRVGGNTLVLLINSVLKNQKYQNFLVMLSNFIDIIQKLIGFIKDINGLLLYKIKI